MKKKITTNRILSCLSMVALLLLPMSMKAQTGYELYVGGTQVTTDNAANITGAWLKSGSVAFDAASMTLTLTDVSIEAENDINGIRSGLNGLTIKFMGNNLIKTYYASGIYNDVNGGMTITGDSVKVETSQQSAIFTGYDSQLTISKCTVDAKGLWGLTGVTGKKNEKIAIDHATVYAYGNYGSISSLSAFTLTGCQIKNPLNAEFNSDYHAVCYNGDIVMKRYVTIKPDKSAGIEATKAKDDIVIEAIYNTSGRRIDQMQRGINIVRTKKGSTRKIMVK